MYFLTFVHEPSCMSSCMSTCFSTELLSILTDCLRSWSPCLELSETTSHLLFVLYTSFLSVRMSTSNDTPYVQSTSWGHLPYYLSSMVIPCSSVKGRSCWKCIPGSCLWLVLLCTTVVGPSIWNNLPIMFATLLARLFCCKLKIDLFWSAHCSW